MVLSSPDGAVTWVGTPVAQVAGTAAGEMVAVVTVGAMMAFDRMYEAGRAAYAIRQRNDLRAIIDRQMADDSPLLRAVLMSAEVAHWSCRTRGAGAAYTFILKDVENTEAHYGLVARSTRPILMNTHCKSCTCTDKGVQSRTIMPL